MPSIIFQPFQKKIEADGRRSLLELARDLGLPLLSTCGGKKICGKCRVIIESSRDPLPQPTDREKETLGKLIDKGYRLACETVLKGGAIIRIPEESFQRPTVVLTADAFGSYPVKLRPEVGTFYLEVPEPRLDRVAADRERVAVCLEENYGVKEARFDLNVLQRLPSILRSGNKGLTAALWNRKEVIALLPGRDEGLFGVAFDIGTTTVVAYLIDLRTGQRLSVASALNPQTRAGDDVISRIAYCQQEEKGLDQLRQLIRDCLNDLLLQTTGPAGISPDRILEAVIVGNTAMHHFFLGLDPQYLAMAPYPPVTQEGQFFRSRDLGLGINPSAYVHLLPLKAGFVGGDIIAGILATGLHKSRRLSLFIDLGTNGEIVLGSSRRFICCSTAAGPAFEGGHIRWGMRAAEGAIDRVGIDPNTLEADCRTIQDKPAKGICGSGVLAAVAEMIRNGIVGARGNFLRQTQTPRLREGEEGWEYVLVWNRESITSRDIVLTQKDVAEVQMAKAAIRAGTVLLQELLGNRPIKRILLAGAFGNYLDPKNARTIGLIPEGRDVKIRGLGNTAGYGACLALLNKGKRIEAERIARKMEYLELAAHPRFQELFVEGMFFTGAKDYQPGF